MSNVSGPDTYTRIYLVPHPKIVFLYPSLIVAIIAGFYAYLTKNVEGRGEHVLSLIFLVVLGINLSVIAFDFPRTTSLTVFFALLAIAIGAWFFFTEFPDAWPAFHRLLAKLTPAANAKFYFLFAAILALAVSGRVDQHAIRLLGGPPERASASPRDLGQHGAVCRPEPANRQGDQRPDRVSALGIRPTRAASQR